MSIHLQKLIPDSRRICSSWTGIWFRPVRGPTIRQSGWVFTRRPIMDVYGRNGTSNFGHLLENIDSIFVLFQNIKSSNQNVVLMCSYRETTRPQFVRWILAALTVTFGKPKTTASFDRTPSNYFPMMKKMKTMKIYRNWITVAQYRLWWSPWLGFWRPFYSPLSDWSG